MKSFAFRLERVLRWRITSLKAEQTLLEQIRISLETARAERGKLVQALSEAKEAAGTNRFLRGADLRALDAYATRLTKETAQVSAKMSALAEGIAGQILVVRNSDRNVRLLERLRDRRRVEWQVDMNRELDALSADSASGQWLRMQPDTERN